MVTTEIARGRFAVIFCSLLLGMFVSAIDQMVVTTLSLSIVRDLAGGDAAGQAGWLVTTYLLASTAAMPLAGKLSDLYGRKAVYLGAMSLFALGSLGAALSRDMTMLAITRGVQGLGGGALVSATFAVLADLVTPRERGKYQGGFGAVFASSSLLGPVIGGFFADGGTVLGVPLDWHAVFALNIPLGVLAIIVNALLLPKSPRRRAPRLDLLGAVLLVAGVSAGLLALQRDGSWQLGVAAVVVLVGFVLWEKRAAEPILPIRLFRARTFGMLNLGSLLLGAAITGVLVYLTVYVQLAQHVTPTQAGLSLLPLSLGMVGSSTVTGMLASRLGRFRVFILAGAPLLAVGGVLLSTLTADSSIWLVRVYALVVGIGSGLMQQMFVLGIQNDAADQDMGVATASSTFFRTLGGSLGGSVFGALLTAQLTTSGGAPTPAAYVTAMEPVFLTVSAVAVVIFLSTLPVPDRELRDLDEEKLALAELGVMED
ncbi:MFS transporter [Actinokineospora enzanensis]|uniref:MFS transporter n=1 Tax=Actinokineospora enzanensis TaxID=155975 RepID=UPI00036DF318|nr:MFS transporter [Actinokineospora enzanensis]